MPSAPMTIHLFLLSESLLELKKKNLLSVLESFESGHSGATTSKQDDLKDEPETSKPESDSDDSDKLVGMNQQNTPSLLSKLPVRMCQLQLVNVE